MSRPRAVVAAGEVESAVRNRASEALPAGRHPEELIGREIAQNAKTWAALMRLGVRNGTRLPLHFFYETGGPEADEELAEFLRHDAGYEVTIEPDGVSGRTPPMPLSSAALDAWVWTMLCASHMHGGAAFAGWTATVGSRNPTSRAGTRIPGQDDHPAPDGREPGAERAEPQLDDRPGRLQARRRAVAGSEEVPELERAANGSAGDGSCRPAT